MARKINRKTSPANFSLLASRKAARVFTTSNKGTSYSSADGSTAKRSTRNRVRGYVVNDANSKQTRFVPGPISQARVVCGFA